MDKQAAETHMPKSKRSVKPNPPALSSQEISAAVGWEDSGDTLVVEQEDALILYKAMRHYTPTEEERQLYEILLETLEEIATRDLSVDEDE